MTQFKWVIIIMNFDDCNPSYYINRKINITLKKIVIILAMDRIQTLKI